MVGDKMKITKSQLKQIIREEIQKLNEMEYQEPKKIITARELINYVKGKGFAMPAHVKIYAGNKKKPGVTVSTTDTGGLVIK